MGGKYPLLPCRVMLLFLAPVVGVGGLALPPRRTGPGLVGRRRCLEGMGEGMYAVCVLMWEVYMGYYAVLWDSSRGFWGVLLEVIHLLIGVGLESSSSPLGFWWVFSMPRRFLSSWWVVGWGVVVCDAGQLIYIIGDIIRDLILTSALSPSLSCALTNGMPS